MARKDLWNAERELYERIYYAITGRHTKVISIPMGSDDLGYTSSDETIHLARRHSLMSGLSDDEKQFFRMGVFAHEMAHQLFTDFVYFEKVLDNIVWKAERSVVSLFVNLIEDPAIEFSSDREMDGDLLAALRFSIEHIYRKSPKELGDTPFTQLCNALIQFGDMGVLRGNFSSKEAYEYFRKIAPEFNKAVTDPVSKHRIDYAVKWAKLTRPLWETKTQDEDEELMNQIDDIKKSNGITNTSGSKQPKSQGNDSDDVNGQDGMDEDNAKKQKRRDELIEKMNRKGSRKKDSEKYSDPASEKDEVDSNGSDGKEEGSKESSSSTKGTSNRKGEESGTPSDDGTGNGDSDHESDGDESDESGSEKTRTESDESDEESNSSENGEGKKAEKDHSKGQKNGSNQVRKKNDQANTQPTDYGEGQIPNLTGSDIETKERRIDKSILQGIQNTLNRNAEKKAKERKRDDIHLDMKETKYGDVKCLNEVIRIEKGNENAFRAEYTRIMKARAKDIRLLTSSLRQIFQQDNSENMRSLSGKYNVVRASKQSTAKIFDKRREAGNLKDLAVFLLIDESGSMHGEKEQIARESAIVLAETFAALKIPCYIMGFTTSQSYHAVHHHYVSWKNTPAERIALAGIHAESANFDGYAIRNATSILKKRSAEHKILFVLSDGYPACSKYKTLEEGISDTTNAIIEAKKTATVLGIGIGDCMPEVLKHMYQGAFVHTETLNTLNTLTCNLKNILKRKVLK